MQIFAKTGLLFYAAIKLLLIGLFSLSLSYASNVSAKEEIACKGNYLLGMLAHSDPDALVKMREDADRVVHGNSRLWKISKQNLPDSWLFGTMHMADSRVSTLPDIARFNLENSTNVLVEITDMLDQEKAKATILELKHLVYRLDGTTIESDISAIQLAKLKTITSTRALPYEVAIRMQPWMLIPAISNQLCEVEAKKQGKLLLDMKIMQIAVESGKNLVALETTGEQLKAFASLPREFQIASLIATMDMGDRLDDIKETMKSLYAEGEIGMLTMMVKHFSKGEKDIVSTGAAEFQEKLIVQRNLNMAERASEYFEKGNAFMAVGALHLPGKMGLVALLENQGYVVEAINTSALTR